MKSGTSSSRSMAAASGRSRVSSRTPSPDAPPADQQAMAQQHLFIVTGASRGLGAAMARQLLSAPNHRLLCLSRQRSAALDAADTGCEQWAVDLSRPDEAAARLGPWLSALNASTFASATLINNA